MNWLNLLRRSWRCQITASKSCVTQPMYLYWWNQKDKIEIIMKLEICWFKFWRSNSSPTSLEMSSSSSSHLFQRDRQNSNSRIYGSQADSFLNSTKLLETRKRRKRAKAKRRAKRARKEKHRRETWRFALILPKWRGDLMEVHLTLW